MDANNTKFHLLHGQNDWLPVLVEQSSNDLWWDKAQQSVSLAPVVQTLEELEQDQWLTQDRRRGAAFDHYGNTYWINDAEDGIVYQPAATPQQRGDYWRVSQLDATTSNAKPHGDFVSRTPPASMPQLRLRGLTVTTHEYLIVGTVAPDGLLIFDLHGGGPPEWFCWPAQLALQPWDLSCTPDGGFWLLGRDETNADAKVWRFDKHFKVSEQSNSVINLPIALSHDFQPSGESGTLTPETSSFATGISLNDSSPALIDSPIAIEALSNDAFILLSTSVDLEASGIHYFHQNELRNSLDLDQDVTGGLLDVSAIHAHDFTFLPSAKQESTVITGSLFIDSVSGTQAFELTLRANDEELQVAMQPSLLPMREHSGKAIIASGQSAFYDFADRWLPLATQPVPRFVSGGQISGIIRDGVDADCVWHRLIMDACIPAGTRLAFESRAANDLPTLQQQAWQTEPQPYLRSDGSELPHHQTANDVSANAGAKGSWDLLLQNAVGRFIELRITFSGNRRHTPRLGALRIYYPRYSYLNRYLPSVYREDPESASFLDRFLANLEGLYTSLEDKIANAHSLLDTRSTPAEFLDWLGGWLGAFMDPSWDEQRKRLFIDNAYLLFRWRGTSLGLSATIQLAVDECPDQRLFEPLRLGFQRDVDGLVTQEVRVVEDFLSRGSNPVINDDGNQKTSLQLDDVGTRWAPAMGPGVLHQRFQNFLSDTYEVVDDISALNQAWETNYQSLSNVIFSPLMPQQPVQRQDWQRFIRDHLEFTYAHVTPKDGPQYQEFLARRYRQTDKLSVAHGLIGDFVVTDFTDVVLPVELPSNTQALSDWIEFVSLALPLREHAHRFTVLLPTQLGELPSALARRKAQVEEIVNREKPAHTEFEVTFFWALFQVGSARLGLDSSLGDGSRFVAMVLGANFLGQSFLAESHPWNLSNRSVLGRDRLGKTNDIYQTPDGEWRTYNE